MFDLNGCIRRAKIGWMFLIGLAMVFALLYLRSALYPGPIDPSVTKFFSLAIANKARIYNSIPRILYIIQLIVQTALLIWLLFSSVGQTFFQRIQKISRHYWLVSAISIMSIWLLFKFLSLPFSYYTGYYWQKIWGFSTQTPGAWWIEYLKNAGIELIITLAGGLIFFWLVNRLSRYWWLVCAIFFSIWLVVEYLYWPILVSPLFNHFEPLPNSAVVTMVDDLAHRAGLNVGAVLVMDASRQTTLANAYFTGVGTTKRIVIYDTLLRNYSLPEVKAVIAHEMGHWRHNDVIHGLFYGMIGGFIVFGLLTFLLKPWLPENSKKPLQLWAALQLALILLLFVSNPLQNAISREMELNADHFSLELTGDLPGEIQLQKDLASTSLSDLSPPSFIVWFSYSHPPALARIDALEKEYP
ncbi:Zn-dependent protease with chaperone function [Candidatus Desulfosporosinus infrequens]|uniref:Zn-dependent protease with chaperone function n=1 Tax=Candidatus Desulfosporosinus infrequens TaxID=2043169 RepID=A0A2U3KGR6_9FIRM|nr:Zn-dependent protease with chaperone function [Candidatus Desulfosporosinus infrequens]